MTSAFLSLSTDTSSTTPPTPPLPSPSLSTLTPLPLLYGQRQRRGDCLLFDKTELELKPLLRDARVGCCSLPPLQNVIPSPQPLTLPSLSPLSEEESWTGTNSSVASLSPPSRKGSIASLLNSDADLRLHDQATRGEDLSPLSLKRGRPRTLANDVYVKKRKTSPSITPMPLRLPSPSATLSTEDERPVRAHKGLRQFSKRVCDKVAEKGVTTYNEVADALALDIHSAEDMDGLEKRPFDQKNIRRRVYDALNVLMAMDIIAKDKKQIKWLGIPLDFQQPTPSSQAPLEELRRLVEQEEKRRAQLVASVHSMRASIQDKLTQHIQVCHLIYRNQQDIHQDKPPAAFLPFFVVSCATQDLAIDVAKDGRRAVISHADLEPTSADRMLVEDADVLRHLQFNQVTLRQLATWLPDPSWRHHLATKPMDGTDKLCVLPSAAMA